MSSPHLSKAKRAVLTKASQKTPEKEEKISEITENHESSEFKNAIQFIYATLCTGLTYSQTEEFSLLMNQSIVSEKAFYSAQSKIMVAISDLLTPKVAAYQTEVINARISCNKKFVACFDGAYSHARNTTECIVDIMHPEQKKILLFALLKNKMKKA